MPYGVKVNVKTLDTLRFTRTASKRIRFESQNALYKHGRYLAKMLKETRFKRYPGYQSEDKSRDFLYYRERKLMRSIGSRGVQAKLAISVSPGKGTGDDRARLQEYGGVKHGTPWVNIPLEGAITPTGKIKAAFPTPEASIGTKGVFVLSNDRGRLYMQRTGARLTPLWLQKASVEIPPRFKFAETIKSKQVADLRRQQLTLAVIRAVRPRSK